MSVTKFKITKSGDSGILVLGMFKNHGWYLERPVKWFPNPNAFGTWVRVRGATKFHNYYYTALLDASGDDVARLPPPPYGLQQRFTANLIDSAWIFRAEGEKFDVEVLQVPPPHKSFRIRETSDALVAYLVFQAEVAGLEIQDPATGVSAFYSYEGFGVGVSPPVSKVPGLNKLPVMPGASTAGPWNDFTAPGYLGVEDFEGSATIQTPYSVGLGTSVSYNVLDIHADEGDYGADVHIAGFSTGNTIALPSMGVTTGRIRLVGASNKPPAQTRIGGCGKFGCHYSTGTDGR